MTAVPDIDPRSDEGTSNPISPRVTERDMLDEVERLRAVVESLRERTDEIEGSRITLPDGSILWLHTAAHVDDWLRAVIDSNPTGESDD